MGKVYAFQLTVITTGVIIFMWLGTRHVIDIYREMENMPVCANCCFSVEGIVANSVTSKPATYDCCISDSTRIVDCPLEPTHKIIILIVCSIIYVIMVGVLTYYNCSKKHDGCAPIQQNVARITPSDILV